MEPLAGVLAAALCGFGSLGVPALISSLPEPPHEIGEETKEPYAAIAALPGLAWRSAAVGALAGAVLGLFIGWQWSLVVLGALVPVGVALALIDWRTRLLPTRLIVPSYLLVLLLVALGALFSWDWHRALGALIGWAIAGGLFGLMWLVYPRGLGYGDVRLSGVLGLALGHLGLGPLLVGIYAGFLLGAVGGGLLALLRIVERRAFPFGPFMLIGAVVGVACGAPVLAGLVGR